MTEGARTVVVEIADMAVSTHPDDVLVTYSLGSCIGVAVHDPVVGVGGLIHCMLPLSKMDQAKAATRPCMFVDTGVTLLLNTLFGRGARKANLVVKVAGAASLLDQSGFFRIGERNHTVFRKIMWKNGILIAAEDIGGELSRTVRLEIAGGRCTVKAAGETLEL